MCGVARNVRFTEWDVAEGITVPYGGLPPYHRFQMTYDFSLAGLDDIPGILALQEMNLPDSGGILSVRLTPDWFKDAILEKSVIVGRCASAMFGELRARLSGRPAMLFIRADNASSLQAHRKMGMQELGTFTNNGVLYVALTYTS